MDQKIFVSYGRQQNKWGKEYLVLCLEAGDIETLIDYRKFSAENRFFGQMDSIQDQVNINLLLLSLTINPQFLKAIVLPMDCKKYQLSNILQDFNHPPYGNLENDKDI